MFRRIPISKKTTSAMRQAIRSFMVGTDGIAGAALVEFTLFMPMIFAMSICTTDFGLLIYHKMQVQHAAQAGAQYASQHGYSASLSCPSSISCAVTNATTFAAIS